MNCECCHEPKDLDWYVVDDNAEVQICTPCAKALSKECKVEKIEVDA